MNRILPVYFIKKGQNRSVKDGQYVMKYLTGQGTMGLLFIQ